MFEEIKLDIYDQTDYPSRKETIELKLLYDVVRFWFTSVLPKKYYFVLTFYMR